MKSITAFEQFVFGALADRDPEGAILRAQADVASVVSRELTGVGVFTKFQVPGDAPRFQAGETMRQGEPPLLLTHPSVPAGTGVILWLTDGFMDTLECYTYDGDWPSDDLLFGVAAA